MEGNTIVFTKETSRETACDRRDRPEIAHKYQTAERIKTEGLIYVSFLYSLSGMLALLLGW